jgi:hypothetical protein
MKPLRSILDPSFRYVPAVATSVAATWRRAGWRPTTDEERRARRYPRDELVVDWIGEARSPIPFVARPRAKEGNVGPRPPATTTPESAVRDESRAAATHRR